MSLKVPTDLLYSKHDEWVKVDGNVATIGITDYAQNALSDIVYLEVPDTGEEVEVESEFGVVESVKAASDLFAPVGGTIVDSNADLVDGPEEINADPYAAWMIKVEMSDSSQLGDLMSAEAYIAYCEERA